MGIRGLKPKPEVLLGVILVLDVVGIALGCLWVYGQRDGVEALQTRRTHGGRTVRSVALSPAGRLAASGGDDGTVEVWDLLTGQRVARFTPGRRTSVYHVFFTADGSDVLAGCQDGSLSRWNVRTGRRVWRSAERGGPIAAAAVSPDGGTIATSDARRDGLLLRDAATGRVLPCPIRSRMRIAALAFSPDGRRLLAASSSAPPAIWDLASGNEVLRATSRAGGESINVDFDPTGEIFVCGGAGSSACLLNARTGRRLRRLEPDYPDYPQIVRFTPDGRHLLVATRSWHAGDRLSNTISVLDAHTGKLKLRLVGHTHAITCLAVARAHDRVISGSEDGTVRVWKIP